ncbi:MAG: hypothetical protein CMH57_14625 [Myxococcales bacterium]|nr:hypothetical protein [Myxococcales bacterium]
MLHYGPMRSYAPEGWPLPVGHPEIYFEDDVDALMHVLPQGVLWAMCKVANGWDRRALLVGREVWSAQARQERFWEANHALTLEFGEDAVQLCEGLFNVVAKRPQKVSDVPRHGHHTPKKEVGRLKELELKRTGEQLLTYWMLSGLWKDIDPNAPETRHRGDSAWAPLVSHFARTQPMLELRHGPWLKTSLTPFDKSEAASHPIVRLIEGPLRHTLPWWLEHSLERWLALEHHIWQREPEGFIQVRQRQRALLSTWIEAIGHTQWFHLLTPFMDLLRRLWLGLIADALRPGTAESASAQVPRFLPAEEIASVETEDVVARALALLNTVYSGERQQDRYAIREAWGSLLGIGSQLSALYAAARRVHPAERDAHHVWIIDWWARENNDALLERLDTIARGIEGRLG